MRKEIALSAPNLSLDILDVLRECIESGWVSTGGRFITEFENKVAEYVGVEGAVGMQSGTAGLHVALRILGVAQGDIVIVPTLTFIAAVNPVKYLGAEPVFMDCDETFCMDPEKLEQFCERECQWDGKVLRERRSGRRVVAVLPVHVFGNLCDLERIMEIAQRYGLKVLEDATEALGSYYTKGAYAGRFAGTIGDMGVYSFNANKIITTGGGGMIVSQKQEYLDRSRYLGVQAKNDTLYFVHDEIGYNYRMLNLQAALGVSQIDQLEEFIQVKRRNYQIYCEQLNGVAGLRMMPFHEGQRSNHWFYSLYVDAERFGMDRDALMHRLIAEGIQCRPVWKLIHTQKPYQNARSYEIERAFDLERNVLNIPCSTNLTAVDALYVSDRIRGMKS